MMLVAVSGAASSAEPKLRLAAEAGHLGRIGIYLIDGPPGATVEVSELVGRREEHVKTYVLDASGSSTDLRALPWTCARRVRHLSAVARLPGGGRAVSAFVIRTPSCSDRLRLSVARRARTGARVRVTIRDRWRVGRVRPWLCVTPPKRRRRCGRLRIAAGRRTVSRPLRVRTLGRWKLVLVGRRQRLRRALYVGVPPPSGRRRRFRPRLILAGDSQMDTLDSFIEDGMGRGNRFVEDKRPGTGLSKPSLFDWPAHSRRQRLLHARGTVVFLGANEGVPMRPPGGRRAVCCGPPWIAEYARRVRQMMRNYARRGRGRILWVTIPAPRDRALVPVRAAVNAGIRQAAARLPYAEGLALDEVFSPGFRYRSHMEIGGKRGPGAGAGGVHLSVRGWSYAARLVVRGLKAGRGF